jgi:hypothetical protein
MMPWLQMSIALIVAGILGIVLAVALVKMGYGGRMVGMVSKGSRLALRAVTKRLRRRH